MIRGVFCANTTKVIHLLRAHGCHLDLQLLKQFDDSTAAFISRVLGGDLHEQALEQAALGLNQGGLGFRKAEMLAAPAHLASLVEARPCVAHLLRLASEAGIDLPGAAAIYDSSAKRPPKDCLVPLDPSKGHLLEILCSDAAEKAAERFNDILAGVQPNLPETPAVTGRSGDRVISAPEGADPEIIRAIKPIKLHHDLSILFDRDGLGHLLVHFVAQPKSDCDYQRLKDMRHKTVSSKWLWSVDSRSPLTLDPEFDMAATRLRLGAGFTCQPINRRLCNRPLDVNGTHAICCAPGEGTRGHNEIRDVVFHVTKMAATTAEREVFGLLDTAPRLRPTGILTSAVIFCSRHWHGRSPRYSCWRGLS